MKPNIICLISLFIIIIQSIYAQENIDNVLINIKNGKLTDARNEIEKIINTDTGRKSPKAWLYRGAVYQLIHENDTKIANLDDDALNIAYKSYLKSIELDKDNEFLQKSLQSLGILANLFVRKGIDEFNNGEYCKSLTSFENTININNLPAIMYLDTIVYYNAAFAAEKCNKNDIAHKYYRTLILLNFEKPKIYEENALLYKKENDIDNYIKTLEEGISVCKDNNTKLIYELLNYYMSVEDKPNIEKYIDIAIEKEPENPNNYYIKGSMFEQNGDIENAEKYYQTALKYNPEFTDALFNLGAIYYNQGIDLIKNAKTKKEKAEADAKYKKALPYFEKVSELEPSDDTTLKLLLNIYKITGQEDKQKETERKLKKINNY